MKDAKNIGDYVALVHFHKEVTVEIPVKVVAENASAETKETSEAVAEEVAPIVETPVEEEEAVKE
jgi:large subunit ribosomal protein L9